MQIALEKVNKVASKLFGKGWGEDAQEPWLAGEWRKGGTVGSCRQTPAIIALQKAPKDPANVRQVGLKASHGKKPRMMTSRAKFTSLWMRVWLWECETWSRSQGQGASRRAAPCPELCWEWHKQWPGQLAHPRPPLPKFKI